jgi:hypothetical protein
MRIHQARYSGDNADIHANFLRPLLYLLLVAGISSVIIACSHPVYSQQPSTYVPLMVIKASALDISTDNLQNLYVLDSSNTIRKYNAAGSPEFQYSDNTLGQAGYMDTGDPFITLIYYPDFHKVLLLDKTLNPLTKIDLQQLGFIEISVVCLSSDKNIWIFDEMDSQVKKINTTGKIIFSGQNLNLSLGRKIEPAFIKEQHQMIFMQLVNGGILIFDAFGSLSRTIEMPEIQDFQVIDGALHFTENGDWVSFNLKTHLVSKITLPPGVFSVQKVRIEKDRVFLLKNGEIHVYRVQKP